MYTISTARTGAPITIDNANSAKASLVIPNSKGRNNGDMHIILKVTDSGTPALTRYQRVIINVTE